MCEPLECISDRAIPSPSVTVCEPLAHLAHYRVPVCEQVHCSVAIAAIATALGCGMSS